MNKDIKLITDKNIVIPARKKDTNKRDYGSVMIVGGSVGYTGAPRMAARACLRTGAGLTYLCVPEEIYDLTAASMDDEAIVIPFESCDGKFSVKALKKLIKLSEKMDACVIGPGMGRCRAVNDLVTELIVNYTGKLIIDADALYSVSKNVEILKDTSSEIAITPHHGEFLRLIGNKEIPNEADACRLFSERFGCITILKGPETYVAFQDGTVLLSDRGNPGMATGGSGDVLAGIIGGFSAQFELEKAVQIGAFIHGETGDAAAAELGQYSMLPQDMIQMLPKIIKKYTK